jgi:predicted TIM-barrel fold metal-dependent hydrolase
MTATIIDVDSHVIEPRDLFTARVSRRWGDLVPHVGFDEKAQEDAWYIGDKRIAAAWSSAASGHEKDWPPYPRVESEVHPAASQLGPRTAYLDGEGIERQVLYPNVAGFGGQRFLLLEDPALMLECVQAYNDFLVEWAEGGRFIPIAAIPYWDVDAAVTELQRAASKGHRGVLFSGAPHELGMPFLAEHHWDPVWAAAEEAGLPISFHLGSGDFSNSTGRVGVESRSSTVARVPTDLFLGIAVQLNDLLFSGILPRFPDLKFVMVESGIGAVPFVLESADYHFARSNLRKEWPWYDMKPSEYFRRQVLATFWFETPNVDVIERVGWDNVMFETDFPHLTSLRSGQVSGAVDRVFEVLGEERAQQIVYGNASRLYPST